MMRLTWLLLFALPGTATAQDRAPLPTREAAAIAMVAREERICMRLVDVCDHVMPASPQDVVALFCRPGPIVYDESGDVMNGPGSEGFDGLKPRVGELMVDCARLWRKYEVCWADW
jgi:hypothetical protein